MMHDFWRRGSTLRKRVMIIWETNTNANWETTGIGHSKRKHENIGPGLELPVRTAREAFRLMQGLTSAQCATEHNLLSQGGQIWDDTIVNSAWIQLHGQSGDLFCFVLTPSCTSCLTAHLFELWQSLNTCNWRFPLVWCREQLPCVTCSNSGSRLNSLLLCINNRKEWGFGTVVREFNPDSFTRIVIYQLPNMRGPRKAIPNSTSGLGMQLLLLIQAVQHLTSGVGMP